MRGVKIKCPSCHREVDAVQYPKVKIIQGFCSDCEKQITVKLRKGCGIPMLIEKEDS